MGILVGTDKDGLKLWRVQGKTTVTLIPDIQVRVITPFNPYTYWIGSESGVYIYNILKRTATHLTKSLTNEYTIGDNAIYSIFKDREGGMWVGTFFGGLSYLPNEYISFNRFIGGKTHPDMLGNAVREICPDDYGNLWIGTEDNGINRYNLATGGITNFSYRNKHHPLSATNIHGLMADGNRLWIGTYNKGIDILDIPSGKVIRNYCLANTNYSLLSDFVLCFTKTSSQGILIGTSAGTVRYNSDTDRFHPWKNITGLIKQMYEDQTGAIWVASTEGVFRYVPEEDRVYQYTADPQKLQSLGSNNITSIFEDSQKRIWVTTVNGMSLYNRQADTFNRITTEDGLPSNIVYRILEDEQHYFWTTTANGLVKFNPETHTMRVFSFKDGLHESQFNYSSAYQSPDGMMYMGTINGMISFYPRLFKEDTFVPPIYILPGPIEGKKTLIYRPMTICRER
ncbi:MAG: hypothetical protein LIP04_09490 [Tannerellaceae bacterium]|nr:hypothetical protein [Tannerellaceae bacterium]